ncbi:MAG: polynucleotide kinase-phosphatase [Verrucomicrobia bacterium]|nr:polynucleotide kinase-phosphatase [Verrucomicrobiota bacterium]
MTFTIPELSFVVLIGVSGSGKSTFARKHFKPTEILSSDACRGLVSDDENSQAATKDAFELLHFIARKRLAAGKLTVVDATNVQPESRKPLVGIAREFHCLPVAIVLDVPERVAHDRNKMRPDRDFGPHVIRQQSQQLHRSLRGLEREGFRHVHVLKSLEEIEAAVIERQPLWNNLKHEHGPFDIIGDVHGCFDELVELLGKLGYVAAEVTRRTGSEEFVKAEESTSSRRWLHPDGRKLVFVGDLVDRGPKVPQVLKLVMNTGASGAALCVPGNHDVKLMRKLRGRDVQITHGLAESLAQLADEPEDFRKRVAEFIDDLVSHYVLDDGKLVVAHAGMKESMQGRGSGAVREFALFGETTGETDEFGLPVRYNWAAEYRGAATVVYGHTPVPEPEWLNRTINIDTGCVFGGKLTALRYPEKELVSVAARQVYATPAKPFPVAAEVTRLISNASGDESQSLLTSAATGLTAQQQNDDLLDLADVTGKRIVSTRLRGNVTIREENSIAALEVMSRFAANPKWLIYLPPTMSPSETSQAPGLLEHPAEAFAYFRHAGVPHVVCEEKHMGSRAVVIICRDEDAARKTFGVTGEGIGICYTRTGRRFFDNTTLEVEFLERVRAAATAAGFWDEFKTDWLCLDCELMPWSAKAQELVKQQYAAVGASAQATLAAEVAVLKQTAGRGLDVNELLAHTTARRQMVSDYIEVYRRYCWPVNSVNDLKLAPFHLLATEGKVHTDKPHDWHMQTLARLEDGAPLSEPARDGGIANRAGSETGAPAKSILIATPFRMIDVTNPESEAEGIRWWEELTGRGGEGMVVKPLEFIAKSRRGLVQPAVKCRGREYLRIIYGPEYTAAENLERLRARGLSTKRSLALREFALGIESLERFVRKEPLRRVHEAVFGVLALESEPVDPRL